MERSIAAKSRAISMNCLAQRSPKKTFSTQRRILESRLDNYEAGLARRNFDLIDLPPSVQPVPCKPLLVDVAFNDLELPDITARTLTEEERKKKESKSGSGGFFSWLRG